MTRNIYNRPTGFENSRMDRNFQQDKKKASLKDRILLSPVLKYVVPLIVVVIVIITATYLGLYFGLKNETTLYPATCNIKESYRVECFPGKVVTYDRCEEVGCCWNDETKLCFHSLPSRHGYTKDNSDVYYENEALIPRTTLSPLGSENFEYLFLRLNNIDANHVEIIFEIENTRNLKKRNIREKVSSPRGRKFVVHELTEELLDFIPNNIGRETFNIQDDTESKMNVYVHLPEFSVTVTRKDDPTSSLLSTARGPFILTKRFWEFTLYVTNSTLYGLNKLELNGTTHWIYDNENGTARPNFLGIDGNGQSTGCYLDYEGPMEIKVLDESNLVVLRGMSSIKKLSLHVFAGPNPVDAIKQMAKAQRKNLPSVNVPVSSLGLHICPNDKYNDDDDNEDPTKLITLLDNTINQLKALRAPWDSHCLHEGFNPTLGNQLTADQIMIVNKARTLLGEERLLVPHLSPMLFPSNPLALKLATSSLLLRNLSDPYVGLYRNQRVFYPDWYEEETQTESLTNLTDYLDTYASSKLFYLRDSWPKDETREHPVPDSRTFDYMPSELKELMSNRTVPYSLDSSTSLNDHYARHSEYGKKFRDFTSINGWTSLMERGLWGETGNSSWTSLSEYIRVGVGSCLVGELPPPMYICGTSEKLNPSNKNDELCSRWYETAVMWPHVLALTPKLPGGDHLTITSSLYAVKHLTLRTSLVTYARTILAKYYVDGSPILAPTSIYYPQDFRARRRENQFFWGDSILVGLVTLPNINQVLMWLPGKYSWRHLKGGSELPHSFINETSVSAVEGQMIMLVRPGFIVPIHEEVSMISGDTMKSPLTLVANLAGEVDYTAEGKIFFGTSSTDGVFLLFSISQLKNEIQLDNILEVQKRACLSVTVPDLPSTIIKNVEILGVSTVYNVNINLCSLTDDTSKISLKNSIEKNDK